MIRDEEARLVVGPHRVSVGHGEPTAALAEALDLSPTATFVLDRDSVKLANQAAAELVGLPIGELLGTSFTELLVAGDQRHFATLAERLSADAPSQTWDARFARDSEDPLWVELSIRRIELGGEVLTLATATDVSRHKTALFEAREHEARLRLAQRAARTVAWEWRTDEDALILSDSGHELVRFLAPGGRLTRNEFARIVHPDDREPLTRAVQECLDSGQHLDIEVRLATRGSEPAWVLVKGRSFPANEDWPVRMIGVITDITASRQDLAELRRVEREMLYLATHDGLTGLVNRTEFEQRLCLALQTARYEGRIHALCYLDLDQFKLINDSCGHLAGDEMLRQIGSLVKCRFRESDVVARLGGDEFGVLLDNCPPEHAREIADDLCRDIRRFGFAWEGRLFTVGVSVGLLTIDHSSGDVDDVLSLADGACYLAKEKGGNRVHIYQPDDLILARRDSRVRVVESLHTALESGGFVLHRQLITPLVSSSAGLKIYELLIRLLGEDGQLIQPNSFIPVAERHRLASKIDRWVVKTAIATLKVREDRRGKADNVAFAVNLSGQSVGDDAFMDFLLKEIDGSGVDTSKLLFEITETTAVSHLGHAQRLIGQLKGIGCRFVLDDFGTGMSSFGYLSNLPVDFIKIDGQFIKKMLRDPIQRALVESINHIGHVMQMKTVAESVEDADTFDALRKLKVDFAQGFWIARPEPLGDGQDD